LVAADKNNQESTLTPRSAENTIIPKQQEPTLIPKQESTLVSNASTPAPSSKLYGGEAHTLVMSR